jgi:CrcB protein
MLSYLLIAIGGALGSVARFWFSQIAARHFGDSFPWGTLLVNISGSFAIGFFASLIGPGGRSMLNPNGQLFFMVGVCGGYTTFSAFSLQTLNLLKDGKWLYAAAYSVLSVLLCLAGVWLGQILATSMNPTKGA